MRLDFSSETNKNEALSTSSVNYDNGFTAASAFLLVLKDLDYETMDNLCEEVSNNTSYSSKEIYDMIQGECPEELKEVILKSAYDVIDSKRTIGNKTDGKHNASAWISHSLFEGRVSSELASAMGLNPDVGMKLGILHDIGRKFDQSFMHTIKGYEYLCSLGHKDEAICCLTHSFLSDESAKGNRCANCDPALEGFYVTEEGKGVFRKESNKDDITYFLEQYDYNLYDIILNISDLMATSKEITSPYDRVLDVYTRKTPDTNSPFFKVCFVNALRRMLYMIYQDEKYSKLYNKNDVSDENVESLFIKTSDEFMSKYIELQSKNRNKMI
ncbi:MAG: hypothetical protein IKF36_00755 [Bacilli bacterium]|nr:hypothetical protein [Bacilli bacterium]